MSHIAHVYIDESGDLGVYGSKFFIVAAIIVDDPLELKRIIKKLRQRKLKKKIKDLPEIKANKATYREREYVLNRLKAAKSTIFAIAVEKNKIKSRLFSVKDKLYNYLCGILIKRLSLDCQELNITIDRKHTNTLIQQDFNRYITSKLSGKYKEMKVHIVHEDSSKSNELQVVDFLVWAISRKFNTGDDTYFLMIKDKITNKENMMIWNT